MPRRRTSVTVQGGILCRSPEKARNSIARALLSAPDDTLFAGRSIMAMNRGWSMATAALLALPVIQAHEHAGDGAGQAAPAPKGGGR